MLLTVAVCWWLTRRAERTTQVRIEQHTRAIALMNDAYQAAVCTEVNRVLHDLDRHMNTRHTAILDFVERYEVGLHVLPDGTTAVLERGGSC